MKRLAREVVSLRFKFMTAAESRCDGKIYQSGWWSNSSTFQLEFQKEFRLNRWRRLHCNVSTVRTHNLFRKTQPNAGPLLTCREKWNKNMAEDFVRDTGAVVVHFDDHISIRVVSG